MTCKSMMTQTVIGQYHTLFPQTVLWPATRRFTAMERPIPVTSEHQDEPLHLG